MEKPQGTSFIPKQPTRGQVKPRTVHKVYVFTYISMVLFFMSLVSSAVVFGYTQILNNQLEEEKTRLADERANFNEAGLEAVREFDARIDKAAGLLYGQVAVSRIFAALESMTAQSVQITGLAYGKNKEDQLVLELLATTNTINATMFQRDVLSKDDFFKNATFDEVDFTSSDELDNSQEFNGTTAEDRVTFLISKQLNISEIEYDPDLYRLTDDSEEGDVSASSTEASIADVTDNTSDE
ncbi:MAG: hypothetical protein ACI92I_000305 [Acidimicrobiales bacterium]|jgi:hypothetical protein